MPGVAESALVGVPHPDFGEVGVAVVIAKPGAQLDADAIWPSSSRLANFKIPKSASPLSKVSPLGFGALPGFACVRLVGFRPFGPLALV